MQAHCQVIFHAITRHPREGGGIRGSRIFVGLLPRLLATSGGEEEERVDTVTELRRGWEE